jgi:hypothetical protein
MLEVMHPDFPQEYIQSQDNKKRPHAGGHATRLSTEQSFQTQDNKRKHQPMHFLLTKYSFYRMGLATIFMTVLTQLFYF